MKEKSITGERDREATEKRLLYTIGKMIAEDGFEKIGINATVVCQLAEQKLQPSSRSALQSVTHYVHAEQKQAQTADKR